MKKQETGATLSKAGLAVMLWLLVFQSPLEEVWGPFFYIDELAALFGACLGLYDILIRRKGRPGKEQLWIGIPLLIFIAAGLAGNLLYRYQPLKCVIIDLYTNLKFFFAIGTGYYLFASLDWEEMKKTAQWNAKVITLLLFGLFLADRMFHIWPAGVRYGIPSSKLIFHQPTYLAGAMAFLAALMTVFYDRKNIPFIAMTLAMMAFTLRAKSLASAAVYVCLFAFFLIFQWKLRLWHVVAAGVGSIAIAWNKIRFYFFELSGHSARSVLLQKSFEVMRDHFPVGSGFGTYGSAEAAKHYSPVYVKYGLNLNYELRNVADIETTMQLIEKYEWRRNLYQRNPEKALYGYVFLMDACWPTVFAQGGVLGTTAFLVALGVLVKRCLDVEKFDRYCFTGVLFVLAYVIISSLAEPAFFNSVAIPLALLMGMVFSRMDAKK